MASSQYAIPDMPRVISPSPTPSEASARESYFGVGSRLNNGRLPTNGAISEEAESDGGSNISDSELQRARPRSRSPHLQKRLSRRTSDNNAPLASPDSTPKSTSRPTRRKPDPVAAVAKDKTDGKDLLSPPGEGFGSRYWRNLSRSPSPFGLIPIHREWRTFVHRHEIPRKGLHVSIGFLVLYLYKNGTQTSAIHPILLSALIPIFTVDVLRFQYAPLNRIYLHSLGAFMRESEAHDKYNGVVSYLAGAWFVMYFCDKDVAVVSILLLSWCDTAASTFGRWLGRYTPRIRKGKSVAGSAAAALVGVGTAVAFWSWIAPSVPQEWNEGVNAFAFRGVLTLPRPVREVLGLSEARASVSGVPALVVVSLWSGLVVSVSEALDVWGLDDNVTIPILCGIGLGVFLKVFG